MNHQRWIRIQLCQPQLHHHCVVANRGTHCLTNLLLPTSMQHHVSYSLNSQREPPFWSPASPHTTFDNIIQLSTKSHATTLAQGVQITARPPFKTASASIGLLTTRFRMAKPRWYANRHSCIHQNAIGPLRMPCCTCVCIVGMAHVLHVL